MPVVNSLKTPTKQHIHNYDLSTQKVFKFNEHRKQSMMVGTNIYIYDLCQYGHYGTGQTSINYSCEHKSIVLITHLPMSKSVYILRKINICGSMDKWQHQEIHKQCPIHV